MSYIFKEDANSVVLGNSNAQEVIPLNRKGATSNVYIVRIDGKEHFMKQLRPQLKDDWRYRSVYRKEFEVGHSINSEYIVKYEAIGENAEGTYILMEHVNGLTLDEKIASVPEYFTKEENFEKLFVQLLHGLKALHAANVAHLDLNPRKCDAHPGEQQRKDCGPGILLRRCLQPHVGHEQAFCSTRAAR